MDLSITLGWIPATWFSDEYNLMVALLPNELFLTSSKSHNVERLTTECPRLLASFSLNMPLVL